MNNLESIVPPLELCKQIPAGAFADSALVYIAGGVVPRYIKLGDTEHFNNGTPAPTLGEILGAFEDKHFDVFSVSPEWIIVHGGGNADIDENPAAAALRLWLEVEGVK